MDFLHKNAAALLSTKVADCFLAYSVLKATKTLYGKQSSDSSQKLVSALNHGGLWIITQRAQQIFLKAECHFRQFTSETDLRRLDISGIKAGTHEGACS